MNMAQTISDSDSDVEVSMKPQPKRRRLIDPSSVAAVSIYKVSSSLQFKPTSFTQDGAEGGDSDVSLWALSPPKEKKKTNVVALTDSESEEELDKGALQAELRSPSPPPGSPTVKMSRRTKRHLATNRRLGAVGSPSPTSQGPMAPPPEPSALCYDSDDNDLIIMSPSKMRSKRPQPSTSEEGPLSPREFTLKFRCRTDLYKIPVLSTAPLVKAVDQLSVKLNVPPSRILLLRRDMELPVQSTARELGLGVADIIDCVIIGADRLDPEDKLEPEDNGDIITLRLQGKENSSRQEYSIHKDAPFGSIVSKYLSSLAKGARRSKVRFHFDGSEIKDHQTPSQMDMEDGDVIEVWT